MFGRTERGSSVRSGPDWGRHGEVCRTTETVSFFMPDFSSLPPFSEVKKDMLDAGECGGLVGSLSVSVCLLFLFSICTG